MKTIVEGHHRHLPQRSVRTAAILLAAALLSAPVLAQRHAQPRSGSSGGGGGSSSSSHRAPSGGSSGGSHGSSAAGSSSSRSSGSSAYRDGSSGPHRPPGVDRDRGSHHGYYYPYYNHYYPRFGFSFGYYSPYYYSPYYYPYYGYSPYYYGSYGRPWGYGYYSPRGGYPPHGGEPSYADRQDLGAVALKVRPKTAEVYVDGRYVGAAGSFDGFPTYLWLEPGSYRLELVQEGYANLERDIDVSPGQVLEFKLRLDEGVASRPEPRSDRARSDRGDERDYDRGDFDRDYDREGRRSYPPPGDYERQEREDVGRDGELPRDARRDAAELVLEVRPDDASVYLDGRFVGTGREVSTATEPLVVEAGEHRLQVVHPDFDTEERMVTVRAGEERLVEVTLRRGGV